MTFTLRPYQVECLEAIRSAAARGVRRQLVVMATGAGKTVIFSNVREHLGLTKRMLVVAHRAELLDQAADKISRVNPSLSVEVEQAERRAGNADVVVASVATIGRAGSKRLLALDPSEFDLVVIDEAHHAVARSYVTVLEHLGIVRVEKKQIVPTGRGPLLLGVTATPGRGDDVGLSSVFEEVVYERNLRDMILDGWLVRLRAFRAETSVDLSDVHSRQGDYIVSELSEKVNTTPRNELVVRCYQAMAWGRRALAFCADVQHAHDLAEMFNREWIPAAAITGDTPTDERRGILDRFRRGELVVLTNVMVLTEGFDEPSIGALLMCRPTRSQGLYLQMLGRGTRLHDKKSDLIVIDMADTTSHAIPSAASILGLPPKWNCRGRDVLEQHAELLEVVREAGGAQDVLTRSVSIEDARRLMTEVPVLQDSVELRNELRHVTSLRWMRLPSGAYYLPLPNSTVITVRENQLGHWTARIADGTGFNEDLTLSPHLAAQPAPFTVRDDALGFADRYVQRYFPDAARVVDLDAAWRKGPATDKQQALLRRLKRWRPRLTKGEAQDIIDSVIKRKVRVWEEPA